MVRIAALGSNRGGTGVGGSDDADADTGGDEGVGVDGSDAAELSAARGSSSSDSSSVQPTSTAPVTASTTTSCSLIGTTPGRVGICGHATPGGSNHRPSSDGGQAGTHDEVHEHRDAWQRSVTTASAAAERARCGADAASSRPTAAG